VKDGAGQAQSLPASQAELVVYRPGAFSPPPSPALGSVTFTRADGHQAFQDSAGGRIRYGWEYARGAWAILETIDAAPADVVSALPAIAAGLSGGARTAARLPFRATYLPTGFRPAEVAVRAAVGEQVDARPDGGTVAAVLLTRPAPVTTGLSRAASGDPVEAGTRGVIRIAVRPDAESADPLAGRARPADPLCSSTSRLCFTWTADGRYQVEAQAGTDVPRAELVRLLAGLRLASVDDETTWTAASRAFPGAR
jgi:hypothetical protein